MSIQDRVVSRQDNDSSMQDKEKNASLSLSLNGPSPSVTKKKRGRPRNDASRPNDFSDIADITSEDRESNSLRSSREDKSASRQDESASRQDKSASRQDKIASRQDNGASRQDKDSSRQTMDVSIVSLDKASPLGATRKRGRPRKDTSKHNDFSGKLIYFSFSVFEMPSLLL